MIILISMLYWGCCGDGVWVPTFEESFCTNQVFKESKVVPFKFTYTVNTDKKFMESNIITAFQIQKALQVEGSNFTINTIDLCSASMSYKRNEGNTSAAVFVNLAIVDKSMNTVLLMKENQLLPLLDLPETVFSPEVNINKYLNGKGVNELSKILKTYAGSLNNEGLSFDLLGESSPANTTAHFELDVKMVVAIEYEVCRFVPLGFGLRLCSE
ncbi:MAG: hypothetical protein WAT79_17670 [Saprospiraceae bacterium]